MNMICRFVAVVSAALVAVPLLAGSAKAQEFPKNILTGGPNGTYIQIGRLEHRLRNLNALHEMYCLGHLIEAGVAAKACIGVFEPFENIVG